MLDLSEWFHCEGHVVTPPFLLAAEKIGELRKQLQEHFTREEQLGRLLAESKGKTTQEIDAVCSRNDREHAVLDQRIGGLIIRLGSAEGEFDNWEVVTREFELLVDALEQHEEQEAAQIGWLST